MLQFYSNKIMVCKSSSQRKGTIFRNTKNYYKNTSSKRFLTLGLVPMILISFQVFELQHKNNIIKPKIYTVKFLCSKSVRKNCVINTTEKKYPNENYRSIKRKGCDNKKFSWKSFIIIRFYGKGSDYSQRQRDK